jgi:hypothetical protein
MGKVDITGEADDGTPGPLVVCDPSRWPALDTSHEEQIRQQLADALTGKADPDSRTAALIALLYALDCEHKVIDPRPYGLSRGQLRARAEEIAMDSWVSAAVRQVIAEEMVIGPGAASAAAVGI